MSICSHKKDGFNALLQLVFGVGFYLACPFLVPVRHRNVRSNVRLLIYDSG